MQLLTQRGHSFTFIIHTLNTRHVSLLDIAIKDESQASRADKHLTAETFSHLCGRNTSTCTFSSNAVLLNLLSTFPAILTESTHAFLNATVLELGLRKTWKHLIVTSLCDSVQHNHYMAAELLLYIDVAGHIRGISELGCWMGVTGFWKTGWRNKPRVPTTHTITKIHRNMRSTTMATYFQSSITWGGGEENTQMSLFRCFHHNEQVSFLLEMRPVR